MWGSIRWPSSASIFNASKNLSRLWAYIEEKSIFISWRSEEVSKVNTTSSFLYKVWKLEWGSYGLPPSSNGTNTTMANRITKALKIEQIELQHSSWESQMYRPSPELWYFSFQTNIWLYWDEQWEPEWTS